MKIYPDLSEFESLGRTHTVVPVWTEVFADLETPVSAFLKVRRGPYNFLLESAEQEERTGRYSFLGAEPELIYQARGRQVTVLNTGTGEREVTEEADPLGKMEAMMKEYRVASPPGIPRFHGGFIGYASYDFVRFLERIPDRNPDRMQAPDLLFMLSRNIVIFDHFRRKMLLVSNAFLPRFPDAASAYRGSVREIEKLKAAIERPLFVVQTGKAADGTSFESNVTRQEFVSMVERAKEYIAAGDVIQVVLSQRWSRKTDQDPFVLYRALRSVNPSPYMFHLECGEIKLVGSSPEILVKLQERTAVVRPIAGTRRRGRNSGEDARLETELLRDEKERAEHIMLVDLGRNDLGRVCMPGTVEVTELMRVERYSHVMHLVSNVQGSLVPGRSAFDLLRASFPAGTVTGAPKVRAMEIIEELEKDRRGPYAGAVGYFSFDGDMDFCITIRTVMVRGDTMYIQAGAGIVADSVPEKEYRETESKGAAIMDAYRLSLEIQR